MVKESEIELMGGINVFKSLFLEIEEVNNYVLDEPDFDKETQKVYQIIKNVPSTASGYWIDP